MTAIMAPHFPLVRIFLVCAGVLAAEIPLMLFLGRTWQQALLPGCAVILVAFGAAFCLRAITVAGFITGAAAAGLLLLGAVDLLPILGGAGVLALICGIAPGWARAEAWQATRFQARAAGEEAAIALRTTPAPAGRHGVGGPRVPNTWRTDRVVAAFLVLAFPPAMAAFSLWFAHWFQTR